MHWIVALHAAGGVVLALAGIAKLRQPASTAPALASLRLPSSMGAVRAIGAAELVIGAAGAVAGASWVAWLVALEWAALAVVAATLLRRPPVPCGCFGAAAPTPVGPGHLAVDLAFAALAVVTALGARGDLGDAVAAGRGGWVVVGGQIAVLAALVRGALVELPALRAARDLVAA